MSPNLLDQLKKRYKYTKLYVLMEISKIQVKKDVNDRLVLRTILLR